MPSYRDNATHRLDNKKLYAALDEKRTALGWSWARLAREIGCAPGGSLFSRMQVGKSGVHADFLVSLLVWLGSDESIRHVITANPARTDGEAEDEAAGEVRE